MIYILLRKEDSEKCVLSIIVTNKKSVQNSIHHTNKLLERQQANIMRQCSSQINLYHIEFIYKLYNEITYCVLHFMNLPKLCYRFTIFICDSCSSEFD